MWFVITKIFEETNWLTSGIFQSQRISSGKN
jgi:hypothetical protein